MRRITRRTAITVLGASGGLLGVGYLLARAPWATSSLGTGAPPPSTSASTGTGGMMSGGMMGSATPVDMSLYMEMFSRHVEINRTVEEIPGGVRTTTESHAPDLVAQLHAHVSSMYTHLGQGAEVRCMSSSLPTLFRRARDYQRHLTLTPTGAIAEETATDPGLTRAIRAHAQEVTGFVRDGMPAMMNQMMNPGR